MNKPTNDAHPRIGAHTSIAGGVDLAVDRAVALGCEALQVFTRSSNRWASPPLAEATIQRFREKVEAAALQPVMAHTSYLINAASPDDTLWERSLAALDDELERCQQLGIPHLVLHPGAHKGAGVECGLERVARALDRALARRPGVRILIENTAGQGTCLGAEFDELGRLFELVAAPDRLGVCFDTCHAFAAGHDLSTPAGWERAWALFDEAVGRERLCALHVNDSRRARGSRVDRHAHIGQGEMGIGAFVRLMNDERLAGLPATIETEKDDDMLDDVGNLAVLRRLAGRQRAPSAAEVERWRAAAIEQARREGLDAPPGGGRRRTRRKRR